MTTATLPPIRCLLFDLGGTLWYRNQNEKPAQEAAANRKAGALLQALGAEADAEVLGQQLRLELLDRRRALRAKAPNEEPNGVELVGQLLTEWKLPSYGRALIFDALAPPIEQSRVLFGDTLQTLANLQARGYGLGVVSNRFWGGTSFQEGMEKLGLLHYFDPDKLAISADLGIRKPAPAIFEHALEALGVSPGEAVMVGDKLEADMAGAETLGILPVWRPKPGVERSRSGLVIDQLSQLMEMFSGAALN